MGIRKTVFGSIQEKKCFAKLRETWGKDYNIYHNLPFLNVITAKTEHYDSFGNQFFLSDSEYDHLKKTSIDFTICDKKDAPLASIEFDGLQDGFNVGDEYHLRNGLPGRKGRRALIELKLRVAHGSNYPYFVLGSKEFRGLSNTVRLTIADGLIGEVMSERACKKRIDSDYALAQCGYSQEDFDSLSQVEQSEIIDNWVTMVEVESDFKHNPIVRHFAKASRELEVTGHNITFLGKKGLDPEQWVWLECGVTSRRYGIASVKICLPEFRTPYCFCTVHVAMEIGKLLALEKLREHVRQAKSGKQNADSGVTI